MNAGIRVGVSGSRTGATPAQLRGLSTLLRLWDATALLHGDCVGVDAQAHAIAMRLGRGSYAYPSNVPGTRAHTERTGAILMSEEDHPLDRNRRIVSLCHVLVALPRLGSRGTWHAVKVARETKRLTVVLDDSGCPISG